MCWGVPEDGFLQELGEGPPSPHCMGWGPELTELSPQCPSGEPSFPFCPYILTPMWLSFQGKSHILLPQTYTLRIKALENLLTVLEFLSHNFTDK